MKDIRAGQFVTLDDDKDTIYRVADVEFHGEWASLRSIDGVTSDPNSVKFDRCTPIRAAFLQGVMRKHLNQAKLFADALMFAPN